MEGGEQLDTEMEEGTAGGAAGGGGGACAFVGSMTVVRGRRGKG